MRFIGIDIKTPTATDMVSVAFTVLLASSVLVIFFAPYLDAQVIFAWIMAGASGALLSAAGAGANKGRRHLALNVIVSGLAAGAGYFIHPLIF